MAGRTSFIKHGDYEDCPASPSLVARLTHAAGKDDHFALALLGKAGTTLTGSDLASLNRTRGITQLTDEDLLVAELQKGVFKGFIALVLTPLLRRLLRGGHIL